MAPGATVKPPQTQGPPKGGEGPSKNPLNDEFKEFVESMREHFHVPGLSIAVVDGNEDYFAGYGVAKQDPDVEVTPDTLFYIASMTKSMLGVALLHALEDTSKSPKPLTLDSKIHDVIADDFALSDDYATLHATLKDALSHRIGLARHDLSYGGPGATARDAVRSLRHLPMRKELREDFHYSNLGYMVLQHVVEMLSGGKWLGDVYREAIFEPLDMRVSTADRLEAEATGHVLAEGHTFDPSAGTFHRVPYCDSRVVGPGGVITSTRDFAKYLRAAIYRRLPLSKESQDALVTPIMLANSACPREKSPVMYAGGYMVTYYRGHKLVTHGGAEPGFTSINGFMPEKRWGAVVVTNTDLHGIGASEAIFYRLLDDFLGVPVEERKDSVAQWDGFLSMKAGAYAKGAAGVFPDTPAKRIPHALALEEYAGTYSHPGYREIVFSVAEPASDLPIAEGTTKVLHARRDTEWDTVFDLEHVSGEHFVMYINMAVRAPMMQEVVSAEFQLRVDGKVARLGIAIVPGSEEKIWFNRAVVSKEE